MKILDLDIMSNKFGYYLNFSYMGLSGDNTLKLVNHRPSMLKIVLLITKKDPSYVLNGN